ncbi:multimodular transpeptidase-transglycosylase / penicillin-binding protein 1A/1B [Bacillus cereus]|uniref:multimodular transpeptidase-transglycosylase / penicillin-binding protein 1A/1B n=1 Tax=Bacillus cereus TaxID=1396 RepID=UPI00122F7D5A|nr:multimodular transpeptidase-transglycosylase / penicillin-binding protein 1A/1B [Bacillus cereus]KAA2389434.1 multimodular transpeptidase-transglycosylase / penicillin-binding protein 1A/1B [Bacillus cereus]
MSAFLNLIALISLITSIVFFVKGFKNKPKFKKAALFFCATWALWFVSAMIDPEPTKVNGKQEDKQEEAKKQQEAEEKKKQEEAKKQQEAEEKKKQEEAKKQQEAEEKKKQEEAKKQQEVEEKKKQEEAKKQLEVEEKKKQEEAKKQLEVEEKEKEKEKEEETKKQQEAEQAKDSGLNEVQAQEKAEQLKLAQGQGARNKDVKLSQLGVQTIKDGIQYTTPVQDIHIEAKDSLTRIVAIMPVGTTKEQAKEVGDSLARQVASFGTMGLYVDLHSPSKDYLGEYWENFSGDIGIFDSNEKQLARGYIDKLNPTKIKW